MIKKNFIFALLLLGLIFRVAISFNTYSGDVTNHMTWGEDAIKSGLSRLYDRNFEKLYGHTSPNYPPLTVLIFAFLYSLKNWILQLAWFLNLHVLFFPSKLIFFLNDFNYLPYLFKLPAILSDIGIAYTSYLFIKKRSTDNRLTDKLITILVLFNPAYFYNSAYWGQTDSLPLFFLLTSFYMLIYKKNLIISGVLFTLGILAKQTIFIFTPLFLIILYQQSNMKAFFKTLLVSIIVFWLFFLPFYQQGNLLSYPFLTYLNKILLSSGIPYTSNHAFNFWYLLTGSRITLASSKFIFNISYERWGIVITGLILILILIKLVKNRFQLKDILYAGFLIPLASFLFLTKMHERHLILTLPFLLLLTYNNKYLLISYLYLSLFNFFNMYHDWWSPNIQFLMLILSLPLIINTLTIILTGVFVWSLKDYFLKRN